MSIGPLGMIGAAAGAPLAQKGTESDRAAQDQATQARENAVSKQAAKAEGIGETEQDHEASDRDADGRRVWERGQSDSDSNDPQPDDSARDRRSRDATGDRGSQLDLSG